MNFLTSEQLEKLPTPRILAYKRKMVTQRFILSDCTCRICRSEGLSKLWDDLEASIEAAKEVLATREHVARPSKPLRTRRDAKLAFIRYRRKHPRAITLMERHVVGPLVPPVSYKSEGLTVVIHEANDVTISKAKGGPRKHWLGYPKPVHRPYVRTTPQETQESTEGVASVEEEG